MYIRSLFSLTLALSTAALQAGPQPETITNEIDSEAGELRINIQGQNFGPGPEMLFFHDFHGLEDGTPLIDTEPKVGEMSFGVSHPVVGTYLNQKGFWVIDEVKDASNILRSNLKKQYTDVFIAYSVAIPKGRTTPSQTDPEKWGGSTWKFAWLLEDTRAFTNNGGFDLVAVTQVFKSAFMGGNSSSFRELGNGSSQAVINMSDWWYWNGYNHVSAWVKAAYDQGGAAANFSVSNQQFGFISRDINRDTGFELIGPAPSISKVNFPGWVRNTDEDDFQAIYSNLYISGGETMLARVELTDSKNYETSGYRKVLFPDAWADNRVEAVVNISAFKDRGPLYIHVFNAEGERSRTGLLACQKCPVMSQ